jgi:hypothetical protein
LRDAMRGLGARQAARQRERRFVFLRGFIDPGAGT